ncbi:DUF7535 family protein [Salinirubrum litoreum]|jgi:hypothetical protein|uniref:Uncharacterized protein n=1 Tax=Salinirubrum litoreum TaxID=1126234 RepID=A0ABD5R622_9EURY|nr:hypothetical protein [Salinirubrum litoreum]
MTGSVTPPTPPTNKLEITLTGYVLAAGIGLLMLPILPFLALLWVFQRIGGKDEPEHAGDA